MGKNNRITFVKQNQNSMIIKKGITKKSKLKVVEIDNGQGHVRTVQLNSNGEFNIAGKMNFVPTTPDTDFGEIPFIQFYDKFIEKENLKRLEKERIAKETEDKRIADITERILKCSNPNELIREFNFSEICLANHWNELYSGAYKMGVSLVYAEAEIMEMAVKLLNISGDFGEGKHRDGHDYSEFTHIYGGLKGYQENAIDYFNNSNDYFHKSQESEKEFILEQIKDAADNKDIDEVRCLLNMYDELVDGYYDCNNRLILESKTLHHKKFNGYNEDVYNYFFCFQFEHKSEF